MGLCGAVGSASDSQRGTVGSASDSRRGKVGSVSDSRRGAVGRLNKNLYPHCLGLVGSRKGFKQDLHNQKVLVSQSN